MTTRKRILFFAESVTLAHVARPLVLAAAASEAGHETFIACDQRYDRFVKGGPWASLPLQTISVQRFLAALAKGKPFYDVTTLRGYVEDDLKLIELVKPDLVVGDFRLSLSVSARLAKVPYATISNAYWSPYTARDTLPLPVLPMTRALPLPVAGALFDLFSPLVARQFCRPLSRIRKERGLPPLKPDLRVTYTDADHVLYADIPSMFPTRNLPASDRYIGPILWVPPVDFPDWWDDIPASRPSIYVTLGSSGPPGFLGVVLEALATLPVTVIASTAGASFAAALPANVRIADYLPGIDAAARSALVICNGGSPSAHQALTAGVPVLGLASNMDQFLNMRAIVEAGAGRLLRVDRADAAQVRGAVEQMLAAPGYAVAAGALAREAATLDARVQFCRFVDEAAADAPA